jgi:tryptophan halogenase
MIDMSVEMLADILPGTVEAMAPAARAYGEAMTRRFELAVDFLKLHYCLSRRTDGAFWTDNADPASWSESLRDKLAAWRSRPPAAYDFTSTLDCFSASSYRFILYGMGFSTDMEGAQVRYPHAEEAKREFARIGTLAQRAAATLPDHRALIDRLYAG